MQTSCDTARVEESDAPKKETDVTKSHKADTAGAVDNAGQNPISTKSHQADTSAVANKHPLITDHSVEHSNMSTFSMSSFSGEEFVMSETTIQESLPSPLTPPKHDIPHLIQPDTRLSPSAHRIRSVWSGLEWSVYFITPSISLQVTP